MTTGIFTVKEKVWIYPGEAAWHFINLPKATSEKISKQYDKMHRGWRSLPVIATIGKTEWKSSVFFDKRTQTYLFPLKAEVRRKEKIVDGDTVRIKFKIAL